jgi:hypothetical protein
MVFLATLSVLYNKNVTYIKYNTVSSGVTKEKSTEGGG